MDSMHKSLQVGTPDRSVSMVKIKMTRAQSRAVEVEREGEGGLVKY